MVCEQLVLFGGHAQRERKAFLREVRIRLAISRSPTKIVSEGLAFILQVPSPKQGNNCRLIPSYCFSPCNHVGQGHPLLIIGFSG
jgi:hypothetical protein